VAELITVLDAPAAAGAELELDMFDALRAVDAAMRAG
jgi:hypothetical protein